MLRIRTQETPGWRGRERKVNNSSIRPRSNAERSLGSGLVYTMLYIM